MRKANLFLCFVLALLLGSAALGIEIGVEQNTIKIGQNVVVMPGGEVKTAIAVGGSVTVNGRVKEDVVAVGGNVSLGETALVGGRVVAVGGKVEKAPGAIVKGEITEVSFPAGMSMSGVLKNSGIIKALAVLSLLAFIGFLILVVVLVALFTPQLGKVSAAVEKQLIKTFFTGLLAIILFVPVIIVLAVSIVGIVLIPVWVVVFAAAGLFGYIGAAHFVGKKIFHAFKFKGKPMMLEALSGVIILCLIGLVPFLGFMVKVVIGCCGLGAVALTRFGAVKG